MIYLPVLANKVMLSIFSECNRQFEGAMSSRQSEFMVSTDDFNTWMKYSFSSFYYLLSLRGFLPQIFLRTKEMHYIDLVNQTGLLLQIGYLSILLHFQFQKRLQSESRGAQKNGALAHYAIGQLFPMQRQKIHLDIH